MRTLFLRGNNSDFTVRLAKPIESGRWEMALLELGFCNDFQPNLVTEAKELFYWHYIDPTRESNKVVKEFSYFLPVGKYLHKDDILSQIDAFGEHFGVRARSCPGVPYDIISYNTVDERQRKHVFSRTPYFKQLFRLLNKSSVTLAERSTPATTKWLEQRVAFQTPLEAVNNLFIYTSTIEPHSVGDAHVRLLRQLGVEKDPGEYQYRSFRKPHYYALSGDRLEQIDILIRDDKGKPINFASTPVHLTLGIRRREK